MRFYKKKANGRIWQKNSLLSLLFLLRDCIVFLLPIKRLPPPIVKLLYGFNPKFVFFAHPRRTEDIYVSFPYLVPMRRFLGRLLFEKIIRLFPPFVSNVIRTEQGIDGVVVGTLSLPKVLLNNRKAAIRDSLKGLFFSSKITPKGAVLGLGGLWPMVTRRGIALTRYAKPRDIIVTNGHCGTLTSLFLTIQKLSALAGIPFKELKVAILGAGKMGTNLACALYGKISALTLVDTSEVVLNRLEERLKTTMLATDIQKYTNKNDTGSITDVFKNSHITVCTTSNVTCILKPEQIPGNTIIIDDSRPEAIPRNLNKDNCVVLEGGILKIKGIRQNYDFGFGMDENVFGCLAESFLLAIDRGKKLSATLGDVDFKNLENMISACREYGVIVEDFKSRDEYVPVEGLVSILKNKTNFRSTIPIKNICWLYKVEDLKQV